jgi:hypothetical protein
VKVEARRPALIVRAPMTQALPVSMISTAPERAPLSYQQIGWLQGERAGMVGYIGPHGRQMANLHAALRVRGRFDVGLMERSAAELVRRHEVLRTTFVDAGDDTIPVVTGQSVSMAVEDVRRGAAECGPERARHLAAEFIARPFEYQRDVMLRALVVQLADDDSLLLVTMPHMVSDGRSLQVCLRELVATYNGLACREPARLPEPDVQYRDFAAWQHRWLAEEVFDRVERYAREKVLDAKPLMLPTDRPRSSHQPFTAADHPLVIADEAASLGMWRVARRLRVAPMVLILASYVAVLGCWSEQDEVLLTMPLAGRIHRRFLNAIGFFACFGLLRIRLSDRPSFDAIVARVQAAITDARAMEGLPYGFLVELARRRRLEPPWLSISANILANGSEEDAFTLATGAAGTRMDLELPSQIATPLSRYDLNLLVTFQRNGSISGVLRYRSQLFDAVTVALFARCLLTTLEAVISAPEQSFDRLAALAHRSRSAAQVPA